MLRPLIVAALLASSPVLAQGVPPGIAPPDKTAAVTRPEPSFSTTMPDGVPASSGLVVGWNHFSPLYCYGFPFGDDIIVKVVATDESFIQSANPSAHTAMIALCATGKRYSVYSYDGVGWHGIYVGAQQ